MLALRSCGRAPAAGDGYVVAEGTTFWDSTDLGLEPVPAMITAGEVKADRELREFNLSGQGSALAALREARQRLIKTGDPIEFVRVPVIFFGKTKDRRPKNVRDFFKWANARALVPNMVNLLDDGTQILLPAVPRQNPSRAIDNPK